MLLAVAEQGSFRKAGRLLHLTQPAVTAAIAELEQTLGVLLFDRTARGVTPTAHGESFIARANAIFGELRLAADDIEIISRGSRGTLRIGTGRGWVGPGDTAGGADQAVGSAPGSIHPDPGGRRGRARRAAQGARARLRSFRA